MLYNLVWNGGYALLSELTTLTLSCERTRAHTHARTYSVTPRAHLQNMAYIYFLFTDGLLVLSVAGTPEYF